MSDRYEKSLEGRSISCEMRNHLIILTNKWQEIICDREPCDIEPGVTEGQTLCCDKVLPQQGV